MGGIQIMGELKPFNFVFKKEVVQFCSESLWPDPHLPTVSCLPETRPRPTIAEPRPPDPKPPPASPDWAAAATRKPDPNPRVATFNPRNLQSNDSAEQWSSCVRAGA